MITLIGSVIVFMLVISLHELGHFSVAKMVGIKVNEFSIGMGPKVFQKQKGETKYSLRLLPLGGYVAMEGEEKDSEHPRSFNNVSVFKRMAVVVAGVFMNLLLAIFAFFLVSLILGTPSTIIGNVLEDSPAHYAEIKRGDKVIEINGKKVNTWDDITRNIGKSKIEEPIEFKIDRDGQEIIKEIQVKKVDGRLQIGISSELQKSFISSVKFSFKYTFAVIGDVFKTLKMLFSKEASLDMLSGPVGVISFIGKATQAGFINLLSILGLISANLAVLNILPIPALDGGKFVFLLIEAISGKKINEKVEYTLSFIGIVFLLGMMVYVTIFGDLARLGIFK